MKTSSLFLCSLIGLAFAFQGQDALAEGGKPAIDNERVIARNVIWNKGTRDTAAERRYDSVWVYLTGGPVKVTDKKGVTQIVMHKAGDAVFIAKDSGIGQQGDTDTNPPHAVVIELKDNPIAALKNESAYPDAFPRPHIEKKFENDRVRIWDYHWRPNEPTPMHFHGTDVVAVFFEDGVLASTTLDGKVVETRHPVGEVNFNVKGRIHTETLIRGTEHAVQVELK